MRNGFLLTTGGTIACTSGDQGLEPQNSGVMQYALEQLRSFYDITVQDVMCLDSSNIRPAKLPSDNQIPTGSFVSLLCVKGQQPFLIFEKAIAVYGKTATVLRGIVYERKFITKGLGQYP